MSSTNIPIIRDIILYGLTPVFITGVIGGLLTTLVFLSLRTFRESSCAFYLTIMSIVNIGQLFLGIFSRITLALIGIDGTETSLLYCKCRPYFNQACIGISLTCLCLATIDQYFATCTRVRWQQWCNIKLAHRLVIVVIISWTLHGIPYLVFFNHVVSSTTNKTTCTVTNYMFAQYRIFVVPLVLVGYLPITITAVFGWMAYRNAQQVAYRTIPLVRRELDKQLTVMVLMQVTMNFFTLSPYITISAITLNPNTMNNSVDQFKIQIASTIILIFYYFTFASPFYIYMCASERFRKQLIYVLFTIHLNRWKRPRIRIQQVMPET